MANLSTENRAGDGPTGKDEYSRPDIELISSRPQNRILIQVDSTTHVKKMTLSREVVQKCPNSQPADTSPVTNYVNKELYHTPAPASPHFTIPHSLSMPFERDRGFERSLYNITVSESSGTVDELGDEAHAGDDTQLLLSPLDSYSNPEMIDQLDRIARQLGLLSRQNKSEKTHGTLDRFSSEELNDCLVEVISPENEVQRLSRIDSTNGRIQPTVISLKTNKPRALSGNCPRRLMALLRRLSPRRRRSGSDTPNSKFKQENNHPSEFLPLQTRVISAICSRKNSKKQKKQLHTEAAVPDDISFHESGEAKMADSIVASQETSENSCPVFDDNVKEKHEETVEEKQRSATLPVSFHFTDLDIPVDRSHTLPLHNRLYRLPYTSDDHKAPSYLNAALCAYGYGRRPDWKQFSISPSVRRLLRCRQKDQRKGPHVASVNVAPAGLRTIGSVVNSTATSPESAAEQSSVTFPKGDIEVYTQKSSDNEFNEKVCISVPSESQQTCPSGQVLDLGDMQSQNSANFSHAEYSNSNPERVGVLTPAGVESSQLQPSNSLTDSSRKIDVLRVNSAPENAFTTVLSAIRSKTPPIRRRNSAAAIKARAAQIIQARKNELQMLVSPQNKDSETIPSQLPNEGVKYRLPTPSSESPFESKKAPELHVYPKFAPQRKTPFGNLSFGQGTRNTFVRLQSIPELSPSDSSFEYDVQTPTSDDSKSRSMEQLPCEAGTHRSRSIPS